MSKETFDPAIIANPGDKTCVTVEMDDFTKMVHSCGECGRIYQWSADDIAWQYEDSPFLPCGHLWKFLDRPLVIPCEDPLLHTDGFPFCSDMTCPCHLDRALIREHLIEPRREGLLAWYDERRIWRGQTI